MNIKIGNLTFTSKEQYLKYYKAEWLRIHGVEGYPCDLDWASQDWDYRVKNQSKK